MDTRPHSRAGWSDLPSLLGIYLKSPPNLFRLSAILISALTSLIAVSTWWREPYLCAASLAFLSVLMLFKERKRDIPLYLFCALAGTLTEGAAIYFGGWAYSNAQFMGLPIWLPLLWGIAGLFMIRVARETDLLLGHADEEKLLARFFNHEGKKTETAAKSA